MNIFGVREGFFGGQGRAFAICLLEYIYLFDDGGKDGDLGAIGGLSTGARCECVV